MMQAPDDLAARVDALLARTLTENGRRLPAGPGDALDLDSMTVVALVDALECGLDIRLGPRDVRAENLATPAAVLDLCRRLGARA